VKRRNSTLNDMDDKFMSRKLSFDIAIGAAIAHHVYGFTTLRAGIQRWVM